MPEKQYFTGIDIINAPRIESLTVTEDGTYTASSDVIGYNPVVVNTNQPWQPLQDGYSNFWFELTNDTLSPWLNFSAKNNDAVIDWGDGSGEVALDTLTPTHTYAKAGKYVVKVKGVTGIAAQYPLPINSPYNAAMQYVELNSEVVDLGNSAFARAVSLKVAKIQTINSFGSGVFQLCTSLREPPFFTGMTSLPTSYLSFSYCMNEITLPDTIATIATSTFYYSQGMNKITIPASCESIGSTAFAQCSSLREIHVLATTPPILNANAFQNAYANFVIYVPVGTLSAYQTAWSAYADHILEEGQTPNRAMLSRLAKAVETDTDEEMR